MRLKHIYYYVPPCPKCGSRKTGRYLRTPFSGASYMKEHSLKNGELVRFAAEEPFNNGFCASCGHEWPVKVETRFLTYDEIREEQKARGTESLYREILEQNDPDSMKWDIGHKLRERRMAQEETASSKAETVRSMEPEIIDLRSRDQIGLIYADEELLKKIREVQNI